MNNLNWTKIQAGKYTAQVGSLYLTQEALNDYAKGTYEQYSYTISKEGSKWVVWADDHSESDFDENNFKTLKDAQTYVQDHAEHLLECWQEMWAEDDSQDDLMVIEAENYELNQEKMNPEYHIDGTIETEIENEVISEPQAKLYEVISAEPMKKWTASELKQKTGLEKIAGVLLQLELDRKINEVELGVFQVNDVDNSEQTKQTEIEIVARRIRCSSYPDGTYSYNYYIYICNNQMEEWQTIQPSIHMTEYHQNPKFHNYTDYFLSPEWYSEQDRWQRWDLSKRDRENGIVWGDNTLKILFPELTDCGKERLTEISVCLSEKLDTKTLRTTVKV